MDILFEIGCFVLPVRYWELHAKEEAQDGSDGRLVIIRVKDRINNPKDGYMDLLINVEIGNHVGELQLSLARLLEVKGSAHRIYNLTRALGGNAGLLQALNGGSRADNDEEDARRAAAANAAREEEDEARRAAAAKAAREEEEGQRGSEDEAVDPSKLAELMTLRGHSDKVRCAASNFCAVVISSS